MDFEAITEVFMDRMAKLIDKLEDLPKECPEILDSATFQEMMDEREKLAKDFNEMADKINNFGTTDKVLN